MDAVRLIGPGRAGRSFAAALDAAGLRVVGVLGRGDDLADAARGVDLLLLTTPDRAVADVAAAVVPIPTTVVAHVSGSLGLGVLAPHARRASLHPLVPLPDPVVGADRLRSGITFATAGDPLVGDVAIRLGGRPFEVDDDARVLYHAAACVAANHLVALMGQVERIAAAAGLPLELFTGLAAAALADATALGPAAALTGPAARGDRTTIDAHRRALPASELAAYDAGVALARRLALSRPAESAGLADLVAHAELIAPRHEAVG